MNLLHVTGDSMKDILRAVALITLPAIGILLTCGEVLLRFGGYTPYYYDAYAYVPSQNPEILYELRPGFRGLYAGVPISINSQGFRGREVLIPSGNRPFRVLTIGDSITFGQGVLDDETMAEQLRTRLQGRTELPVDVVNLGVPGYNTCQELSIYRDRGVQLAHDVVLLFYYENDTEPPIFAIDNGVVVSPDVRTGFLGEIAAWARKRDVVYNLVWTRWQNLKQRFGTGRNNLQHIADKFDEKNAGWQRSKACLADLISLAKTQSVRVMVVPFPVVGFLSERPYPLDRYIRTVCEAAVTRGSECFNVVPMLQEPGLRPTVSSVEDHPSAQVYERIVKQLATLLKPNG